MTLDITQEQVKSILNKYVSEEATLDNIIPINTQYSFTSNTRTFILNIITSTTTLSTFLIISSPAPENEYPTNSLETTLHIINQIQKHTDISFSFSPSFPTQPTLDTSLTLVPFSFILLSPTPRISKEQPITLHQARHSSTLTQPQLLTIELHIGQLLAQLHSNLQNDWFGLPLPQNSQPSDPSYSWQETFTLCIETVIADLEKSNSTSISIPFTLIKSLLSRAIGSFLFDDAEVPSLVLFTHSEQDIYISLPDTSSSNEQTSPSLHLTFVPTFTRALFGDPLLESIFATPGPSAAVWEGYKASGGEPLIVFPRQKTKRLWYDLFLGLVALRERTDNPPTAQDCQWIIKLITETTEKLKTAPYY
ncbi:hypothetical protein CVT24_001458 [Panaeolus cyanescens]|uniref:Aminoglycoside phosphotransferase domain-containing protein n=1 Tax=Panaeolus cyanescens TaxID=181874 RepID=A0A409VTA6_9AGAR|nr:hypothetical protein CVT24_001458 [Panaeolus cyanescens]